MNHLEIFEKELIGKDGNTKKINEIIDINRHTWQTESGNIVMKHEGVLLLRQFTGARFLKPELQKEISNPANVVFLCAVQFPNGELSFEIGESNNNNTKGWSKDIKPTMAFKRGYDRAFLRSDYIGLFEVFSEEESEEFKQPISQSQVEITEGDLPINMSTQPSVSMPSSPQMTKVDPLLFLPKTDKKYPGKHIIEDVLKVHKDFEYLNQIPVMYPTNYDYIEAVRTIQNARTKMLMTKQQEAEVFLDSKTQNEPVDNSEKVKEAETEKVISPPVSPKLDIPIQNAFIAPNALSDAESFLNSMDEPNSSDTANLPHSPLLNTEGTNEVEEEKKDDK
ncbi:hypothetical protein U8V72_10655 [Priestia filamentosa]|uniref:hypothetical protein n=1 Tax=Priestia filamentosa TaxID=1402861 RepID=UPI0039787FF2